MKNPITNILDVENLSDGFNSTFLNQVKIFKSTKSTKTPYIYDKNIIIVIQGKKNCLLNDLVFDINPNNYLVVPSTIPLSCQTTIEDGMFLALSIHIDMDIIEEILESIEIKITDQKTNLGIFTHKVEIEFQNIIFRLVETSINEKDTKVLGRSILKELYYRLLITDKSSYILNLLQKNSTEVKISKALEKIHKNINSKISIKHLADDVNMSIASFHFHFKEITNITPLQYVKHIKLTKAKFFLSQNKKVNEVANLLGYEDPSQLSKDYKKYFNESPKEFIQNNTALNI
jgi:AraC-like DNA-binding protein